MNIFEIVSKNSTLEVQMEQIIDLVQKTSLIQAIPDMTNPNYSYDKNYKNHNYSLFSFVDCYCFHSWSARGVATDTESFLKITGLEDFKYVFFDGIEPEGFNSYETYTLAFIQCILNFMYLVNMFHFPEQIPYKIKYTKYFIMLQENIEHLLCSLNLESRVFDERVYLVEHDANLSVLAGLDEENVIRPALEYNNFKSKGDLDKKRHALIELGNQLEPHREELGKLNSQLSKDIFKILNNFNIRHNNFEKGKNYQAKISSLSDEDLEKWYDRCYQKIILAFTLMADANDPLDQNKLKEFFSS